MAKFITRIELHGVLDDERPYKVLHEAMENAGFKQTILSDDGGTYHLLPAEYFAEGDYDTQVVIDVAKGAAAKTNKEYSVFVAEFTRAKWNNLQKV